jgi:integrase
VVELPKGVHRVVARGRVYHYWQPGRGTKAAEKPIAIKPNDPTDPAFWSHIRELQGFAGEAVLTVGVVCDLYLTSHEFARLSDGTRNQYRVQAAIIKRAWANTPVEQLRPSHIHQVVQGMGSKPASANNFLGFCRSLNRWALVHDHFLHSITEGVKPHTLMGGHKPWTTLQLEAAEKHLTGDLRRAFFLARYTGQRASDVIRLTPTHLDEGGFRLSQKKTGVEVWIPIEDALATEMATWDRAPGPYVRDKRLSETFLFARRRIPELAGTTFHGLRATRVVELAMLGLTNTQVRDQVGMSEAMIARYRRFADKKASGRASVIVMAERRKKG